MAVGTGSGAEESGAFHGQEFCVDLLIEHGANVNLPNTTSEGEGPFYGAALQGHALCVDVLIERGADIYQTTTTSDVTPLYYGSRTYAAAKYTVGTVIDLLFDEAGSVGGVREALVA